MAKILIVEDTPSNRKLALTVLRSAGHRCLEAETAPQGIALAGRARPDLILMDIQLRGMDGVQATRALKANPATRAIPVVAVTAYALKEERQRILEAGCDGYVAKPYGVDELLSAVERALQLRSSADVRGAVRKRRGRAR